MIEPLHLELRVDCPAEHAFDVWTRQISRWWPADHSVSGERGLDVVLERRVGGRIFERTVDGTEHQWGEVTRWEPPHRLCYRWHLRRDRADATEVEITFVDGGGATLVRIEHRGWERLGAAGPDWREANKGGWTSLLPHFVAALSEATASEHRRPAQRPRSGASAEPSNQLQTGPVRRVQEPDVEAVVALVHELAAYERAPEQCRLTAAQLRTALFADAPALFGHVAEADGEIVGCALWFLNFSTWDGVHGIYVEDLVVRPQHRGGGLGKALLVELAAECVRRGYSRLQWWVLDWNEPAIGFYRRVGAEPMDEWTVFRVSGDALTALAAEHEKGPPPS